MKKSPKFSPEVRERAVRMVQEHRGEHPSQWAAIEALAPKLGCGTESLRRWVRQAERDTGQRTGLTTDERQRLKEQVGSILPDKSGGVIVRTVSEDVTPEALKRDLGFHLFATPNEKGKLEWTVDAVRWAQILSVVIFGLLAAFLVYIGSRKEAPPSG